MLAERVRDPVLDLPNLGATAAIDNCAVLLPGDHDDIASGRSENVDDRTALSRLEWR